MADDPTPAQAEYPPYVVTDDDRTRWAEATRIARQLFGDVGEANVWSATRSIYHGPIPTGPPEQTD